MYIASNFFKYKVEHIIQIRTDPRFVPSQWERALLCNNISHWLGTNLESALQILLPLQNIMQLENRILSRKAPRHQILRIFMTQNPLLLQSYRKKHFNSCHRIPWVKDPYPWVVTNRRMLKSRESYCTTCNMEVRGVGVEANILQKFCKPHLQWTQC